MAAWKYADVSWQNFRHNGFLFVNLPSIGKANPAKSEGKLEAVRLHHADGGDRPRLQAKSETTTLSSLKQRNDQRHASLHKGKN